MRYETETVDEMVMEWVGSFGSSVSKGHFEVRF